MAFNEKLAQTLKEVLAKEGLEEDKVDAIVNEVEGKLAEEDVPEDANPEEEGATEPSEEEVAEPTQAPEEEPAAPTEGEVPPEEEVVPPGDGNIEQALNELAAQEQGATAPEEEVVPPTPTQEQLPPPIDPSQLEQLTHDLGEANKTIEGLVARINSLEEALKSAGVITSDSKVGDETPRITPNASADQNDAFDDIINVINGK